MKKPVVIMPPIHGLRLQESPRSGHEFEDFVITLFDKDKYRLLCWRTDTIASNGVIPQSNNYPGLEFEAKGRKLKKFSVECKWRRNFLEGSIEWSSSPERKHYRQYEEESGIHVFVAIGVGGSPSAPENLYIFPLTALPDRNEVYEHEMEKFSRPVSKALSFNSTQLKLS